MKYPNWIKIVEELDKMFNREGFDYKEAKKVLKLARITGVEFEDNPNFSVVAALPSEYYYLGVLPSPEDVKKIEAERDKLTETQKRLLDYIKEKGLDQSVAFIAKGIKDVKGKKFLVYNSFFNAAYITNTGLVPKGDRKSKQEALKNAAGYLSGVVYHEAFGHGELGHLDAEPIDNDYDLMNVLEDLVINSRLERKMPQAAELLKNIIGGGVFKDTFMKFSPALNFFGKMQAFTNPEMILDGKDLEEFYKENSKANIDKAREIIKKHGEKLKSKKYNLLNEEANKVLKELYEISQKQPEIFVDKYIDGLTKILEIYTQDKNTKFNEEALDNLVLEFNKELSDDLAKLFGDRWDKVFYKGEDREGEYSEFLNFFGKGGAGKGSFGYNTKQKKEGEGEGESDDKNNSKKKQGGEGLDEGEGRRPGEGKGQDKITKKRKSKNGQGTLENGNINQDKFNQGLPDEFFDEIDDNEAKKQEEKLKKVEQTTSEKVHSHIGDKATRPGQGKGDESLEIEERPFSMKEIEEILSNFISDYILPTFKKTDVTKEDTIPVFNPDVLRAQQIAGSDKQTVIFGYGGEIPLDPDTNNILLSIFDVSGSMGEAIKTMKNAVLGTTCKRKDIGVIGIDNDYGYQGLKVLNPKSKDFDKQKKEFLKTSGFGGTGNFLQYINEFFGLNKNKKDDELSEDVLKFRKDLKDKLENEFDKSFDEFNEKMAKQIALFTDSDIISDLFRSSNVENYRKLEQIMKEKNQGKPIIHLFIDEHSFNEVKKEMEEFLKRHKLGRIFEVYKVPRAT